MQTTSASPPALRLADHVRACCADGQVVLLDLRRSKYVGVGGAQLAALAPAIEGWPTPPDNRANAAEPPDIVALTAPLLAQGLLTRATTAIQLEEPMHSLNAEDAVPDAAVGWRRACRFIHSALTASVWLRYRSLGSISRLVAARQVRLRKQGDPASLETMREVVAGYLRLRPFVFTAHDRCLHDSLTLVHFLTAEGVCANWVIGVRTQPFGAHSWIQHGNTVLNDQHERVRRYQPILVV